MPLLGLRPHNPNEAKRRSTLDTYGVFSQKEQLPQASYSTDFLPPGGGKAVDDNQDADRRRKSSAIPDSTLGPPSPPVQQSTPNTRRFSMMRFRHASDPQLSHNAKGERNGSDTPAVPSIPRNTRKFILPFSDGGTRLSTTCQPLRL
jgi:hypothetical protein